MPNEPPQLALPSGQSLFFTTVSFKTHMIPHPKDMRIALGNCMRAGCEKGPGWKSMNSPGLLGVPCGEGEGPAPTHHFPSPLITPRVFRAFLQELALQATYLLPTLKTRVILVTSTPTTPLGALSHHCWLSPQSPCSEEKEMVSRTRSLVPRALPKP